MIPETANQEDSPVSPMGLSLSHAAEQEDIAARYYRRLREIVQEEGAEPIHLNAAHRRAIAKLCSEMIRKGQDSISEKPVP